MRYVLSVPVFQRRRASRPTDAAIRFRWPATSQEEAERKAARDARESKPSSFTAAGPGARSTSSGWPPPNGSNGGHRRRLHRAMGDLPTAAHEELYLASATPSRSHESDLERT